MASVEYIHGSMYGTYLIDCKVLEKNGSKYKISFFDDICEEFIERWVNKSELRFPKFGDYICG